MKDAKEHPESLDEINSLEITPEIKSLVKALSSDIETEKTNRAFWESNAQAYFNLRYGIRQIKTNPWPGCANYSVPIADADISRLKPSYVNLISVSPIVTFEPYGPEDVDPAQKREQLFDWRMRTQVKFFEPYCYGIDKLLEQGAVVFKTVWKFSTNSYVELLELEDMDEQTLQALYDPRITDQMLFQIIVEELGIDTSFEENINEIRNVILKFREGETKFKLKLLEVKENRPQVIPRNLKDDIVIPVDTLVFEDNLDNARWIDDKIWMTKNDLKIAMRDGKYQKFDDSEIDAWANKSTYDNKYLRVTNANNDGMVLLHETCVWHDINDDGIQERCISTWPDANPENVLRFIELPYDHNQWPYTLVKRELNDPGVYASRGVPALDEDFQVGISTALNQAIDNGTIVNTPKVIYRRGAVTNVRNMRYIPGEPVETTGSTTDYEIRQQVNASQGTLFQQAQYLKSWANERVGNLTAGLTTDANLPGSGKGGNKSATEVNSIFSLSNQIQSMDLQVFQQQMARVYYQIDALYFQFGDPEEEVMITGQEPIKINRQDIRGKFNMVPNGKLDNSTPEMRAMKASKLRQMYLNPSTGQIDPTINEYELNKYIINNFDSRLAGKVLKTQEQIQEEQIQAQMMVEQQKRQLFGESVHVRNVNDAMDVKKALAMESVGAQATSHTA
jgi:hypothetical protein